VKHYPYTGHDRGVVVTQPRPGVFEERPMTLGELAARDVALAFASEIYRLACHPAPAYHEMWEKIAQAIDAAPDSARYRWIRKNAVWRAARTGREQSVTWDLYMPEPDIRPGKLTDDSVASELDAAIDACMRCTATGSET